MKASRVLFARIGWMAEYKGPHDGDPKPKGAGSHNKDKVGHEAFNFRNFDGTLYGFIQRRVKLRKIYPSVPNGESKLDGVTVIFVSTPPHQTGQTVVGWYKKAVVYSDYLRYPRFVKNVIDKSLRSAGKADEAGGFNTYCVEAPFGEAVLLPIEGRLRHKAIPRGKGGFGQRNICYVYKDGKLKNEQWIKQAIALVKRYRGPNLLLQSERDDSALAAEIAIEKKAGFQSNAAVRKAVELYAMDLAQKELERLEYDSFVNTSKCKSYDYTCKKAGTLYFVEVKGTQTGGSQVVVTKSEVNHARKNSSHSIIVIVHSVRVPDPKNPVPKGGIVCVYENWKPEQRDLHALQYTWRVCCRETSKSTMQGGEAGTLER